MTRQGRRGPFRAGDGAAAGIDGDYTRVRIRPTTSLPIRDTTQPTRKPTIPPTIVAPIACLVTSSAFKSQLKKIQAEIEKRKK